MHIVHVITRLILGGAQENTLLTVAGLLKRGDRAEVITGPEIDWKFVNSYSPKFPVRICPFLVRDVSPFEDTLALAWLTGALGRLRPDAVHTHSAKAGVLGRIACGVLGLPAVHTVHGLPYHSAAPAIVKAAYDSLEKFAGRFTDHFVAVGGQMREGALKYARRGVNCTVVRSGIAVEDYEAALRRRMYGIPATASTVGMLTRIAKQKGVDHALFLMSRVARTSPDIVLLIGGDGPLLPEMKRFAANLGIAERVIFAGRIEPENVPRFLNSVDVFLHCSQREGLPRACVQALMCGVPVVSYAVEGITDIVEDGGNGFVVAMNNLADLEVRILQCLKDIDRFRQNVSNRRAALIKEFDSQKMITDLLRIYSESRRGSG